MTDEQRAELKRLAETATQGPWQHETKSFGESVEFVFAGPNKSVAQMMCGGVQNARYIAAANPATVLDLLAQIDDLKYCVVEHEKNRDANVDIAARRESELLAENERLRESLSLGEVALIKAEDEAKRLKDLIERASGLLREYAGMPIEADLLEALADETPTKETK